MAANISIVDVLKNEGVELKESRLGARFRCPFHEDKTPSGFAYNNSNHFVCFGCQEHGDPIDFVMKFKEMSFKDALGYLGVRGGVGYSHHKASRLELKQLLVKAFRSWERKYHDQLALLYRTTHKATKNIKTEEEVERYADIYQEMPIIEHRMNTLIHGTDEQKYKLFMEIQDGF